ncbi:inositol monophosphatase family protein [Chengkuizengella axinellae]|uniref:Inositol-1-monophosphatase n=1 Tax=Chengkuizengella axinellae TaxID=3064388 RepID=A0ABT9IXE7_9BACL|nr:inositol monophosphatase family protein [Chengkuizengella sp. 2205SS18-9]MDP5274045.1 inositol monophosphatase family protein [Chengkuizengella sp. 2205SS18-9]
MNNYLEVAKQIAKEAGLLLENRVTDEFQVEQKKNVFDLVTEMDLASEKLIKKQIKKHFPEHQIIGEEGVSDGTDNLEALFDHIADIPFAWIVDPIDGTTNYVNGLHSYTVSIALVSYGKILIGVIYNPSLDEMFWAEKGKGAFLNGNSIHINPTEKLNESVISTGFPTDIEGARKYVLQGISQLGIVARNIRVLGSAALHCAYVAAGKLNAYWEIGINVWDVAAGVLIVKEAGGNVIDTLGNPYQLSTRNLICSNGKIDQELVTQLKKAQATGF